MKEDVDNYSEDSYVCLKIETLQGLLEAVKPIIPEGYNPETQPVESALTEKERAIVGKKLIELINKL